MPISATSNDLALGRRIRDDQGPDEVARLTTVAALHKQLQVTGRYGVLTGEGRA